MELFSIRIQRTFQLVSTRGIALSGYHFDFSDILKRYFVKQHGSIHEYYAIDKTALRSILYGRIEDIVEVSG